MCIRDSVERLHAHGVLHVFHFGQHVHLMRGHDGRDAFDIAQKPDALVAQAQRGHHAQIGHGSGIEVLVGRKAHIGTRHAQTGIESRAEGGDDGNGQKPVSYTHLFWEI